MLGYRFSDYQKPDQTPFEALFDIFKQLLTYTNGDVDEAISWLTELDKEYQLTSKEYGIGDFINDLKEKGYLRDDPTQGGNMVITAKTEQAIRQQALDKIFGNNFFFYNWIMFICLGKCISQVKILDIIYTGFFIVGSYFLEIGNIYTFNGSYILRNIFYGIY